MKNQTTLIEFYRKNNALCSVQPKEVEVAVREIEQFLEQYRRK